MTMRVTSGGLATVLILSFAVVVMIILGSLALQDKPHYLLALPAAVAVAALCFAQPQLALLLLVMLIPMDLFAKFAGTAKLFTLYKVLLPLALGALLIGRFSGRFKPLAPHPLDRWVLAWIALNCALITVAHDRPEALNFVRRLASMGLLYFVLSRLFVEASWNSRLQKTIVYAGAVSALFSIVLSGNAQGDPDLVRMTGAADTSPNIFGVSLIPPLMLAGAFAFRTAPAAGRMGYSAVCLVLLIGIALTYSRSAVLVLMVSGMVGVWLWRHQLSSRHWVGMGVIVVIALLLAPTQLWDRIASLGQAASGEVFDYSLWRRTNYVKVAANMFESSPIFGIGPGNFILLHGMAEYQTEPSLIGLPRQPHNAYLQVTTETGLVGLAFFLGTLSAALLAALGAYRQDGPERWQAGALFLALIAYTIMGLFSHLLLDKTFWTVLAMIRILPERVRFQQSTVQQ
jgi:O-antigen ligase